jgi:hypothetical protein
MVHGPWSKRVAQVHQATALAVVTCQQFPFFLYHFSGCDPRPMVYLCPWYWMSGEVYELISGEVDQGIFRASWFLQLVRFLVVLPSFGHGC